MRTLLLAVTAGLLTAQFLGMVVLAPPALAQDIGNADYLAIQRGRQIAEDCFLNKRPDMYGYYLQCVLEASQKISDAYVRLGLSFFVSC